MGFEKISEQSEINRVDSDFEQMDSFKVDSLKYTKAEINSAFLIINEKYSYMYDTDYSQEKSERSYKDISGRKLLDTAMYNSDVFSDYSNADKIRELCKDISENCDRDDEIPPTGELLPKYQKLMNEQGYDSIDEMCNDKQLNYDDVLDYEGTTYGGEYKRGFIDCIDGNINLYSEDEGYSSAYRNGVNAASELKALVAE